MDRINPAMHDCRDAARDISLKAHLTPLCGDGTKRDLALDKHA